MTGAAMGRQPGSLARWPGEPAAARILVVVPKIRNMPEPDFGYPIPIGLAYVVSTLKQSGRAVDVINLNHHAGTAPAILAREVDLGRYTHLLTGGLEGLFLQIKAIIAHVRQRSDCVVITGGALFNGEPTQIFRWLNPHYAIVGEAERPITALFDCLEQGGELAAVPSLIFRTPAGEVVCNPRCPQIEDLDRLPWPDFEALDYRTYLDNTECNATFYSGLFDRPRMYYITGSRGCCYHCTFCVHTVGDRYVLRSVSSIMDELRTNLVTYDANIVVVVDDLLGHRRERLVAFAHAFQAMRQESGLDCYWWSNMSAEILDAELIQILRDSGCYLLGFGFESMSPTVLKSMRKPVRRESIERTLRLMEHSGVAIQANFIFGDINESAETAGETLSFIRDTDNVPTSILFIIPSLGSQLFRDLVQEGVIRDVRSYLEELSLAYPQHSHPVLAKGTRYLRGWSFYRYFRRVMRAKYQAMVKVVPKVTRESDSRYRLDFRCPHCKRRQTYRNFKLANRRNLFYEGFCRECRMRLLFISREALLLPHLVDLWYLYSKTTMLWRKARLALSGR